MVFCQILDDNKLILKPKKKLRNIFIFVVCRLCETFEEMLHVAPLWSVRLRSLSGPIKEGDVWPHLFFTSSLESCYQNLFISPQLCLFGTNAWQAEGKTPLVMLNVPTRVQQSHLVFCILRWSYIHDKSMFIHILQDSLKHLC